MMHPVASIAMELKHQPATSSARKWTLFKLLLLSAPSIDVAPSSSPQKPMALKWHSLTFPLAVRPYKRWPQPPLSLPHPSVPQVPLLHASYLIPPSTPDHHHAALSPGRLTAAHPLVKPRTDSPTPSSPLADALELRSGHRPSSGELCRLPWTSVHGGLSFHRGPQFINPVHGVCYTKSIQKFQDKSKIFTQNHLFFLDIPIKSLISNETRFPPPFSSRPLDFVQITFWSLSFYTKPSKHSIFPNMPLSLFKIPISPSELQPVISFQP
jgi:hypothetical protein